MTGIVRGAVAGVLAAGFGVAVAELLAAATRPQAGPLVAVGGAVIDATPTPIKEFAVRELGTYDKPVLLASIAVALVILTAATGVLARRRRRYAFAGAALFGLAGAAAASTRPSAVPYDAVPSLLGATLAGAVLLAWSRRFAGPAGGRFDRRAFLRAAGVVAGGAVLAGSGAEAVRRARGGAVAQSRAAIRLPAPADPAPAFSPPPGFRTPNPSFYRVDTALGRSP